MDENANKTLHYTEITMHVLENVAPIPMCGVSFECVVRVCCVLSYCGRGL